MDVESIREFEFNSKTINEVFISKENMRGLGNLGRMTAEGEIKDDDSIWL